MPIPANQVTHVEIHMKGAVTAAGSSQKLIDNVFVFRRTATVLAVPKAAIETAFNTNVVAPILLALNNRFTQSMNTVRYLNDATDYPLEVSQAGVGAIAGDSMPVSASAFILMRTGLRGKSYRGSNHLGPMSESDTTGATADLFNAAAQARLATVAAAILAGFTDGTGNVWVPSIVSRIQSVLKTNPTTIVANDVISCLPNKRVGWMRHRRPTSVY